MYITPLTIWALCIRIYDLPTVALCIKKTTLPIFTNLLRAFKRSGKSKIKPRTGHVIPDGEEMYCSTLYLTLALDGGGLSMPCPGCFTPKETDMVPIVKETGWVPVLIWTGAEYLPPPVQPIASCYMKYAILAHFKGTFLVKKRKPFLFLLIFNLVTYFHKTLQKIWLWIPKDRDISEASCYKHDWSRICPWIMNQFLYQWSLYYLYKSCKRSQHSRWLSKVQPHTVQKIY